VWPVEPFIDDGIHDLIADLVAAGSGGLSLV
jgi:hypothetical protein